MAWPGQLSLRSSRRTIAATIWIITVTTGCTESGLAPLSPGTSSAPAPPSTAPSTADGLAPVPDLSKNFQEPPVWKGNRQILFDASDRDWDIYAVNLDGSGLMRLTNDPAPEFDAMWSPDGKRIAYRSEREGNSEIYVMNADGSHQLNLTNNPASDYSLHGLRTDRRSHSVRIALEGRRPTST